MLWLVPVASSLPQLVASNGRFVTQDGAIEVQLRGTSLDHNFAVPSLVPGQVEGYKSLGWNLIRLGFHWHLYETQPGVFNETYMAAVEAVVDSLGDAGIYALLDMHQDNWSPLFCGGHGFPAWIGRPSDNASFWRGAVSSAAQRLYSNIDGALDHFQAFWSRVASIFAARSSVVGYGIVNEPWLGDMYSDPALLLPGEADKTNLQPMYATVAQAIRKVDQTTPIWFEPATGGNILDALPVGFDSIPDPNSVLGYHIYCPMLQSDLPHPSKANQTSLWEDLELCLGLNGAQLDIRQSDADRLGVPGVLTEFGSVSQMNQTAALLRWTVEQAEQRIVPWVYWLLTPSTNPLQPNWEDPILRRPYVQSLPGRLNTTAWNETTRELSVVFTANCSVARTAAPVLASAADLVTMVVFTPPQIFAAGVAVTSIPPGAVSLRQFNGTTGFSQLSVSQFLPPCARVAVTVGAA